MKTALLILGICALADLLALLVLLAIVGILRRRRSCAANASDCESWSELLGCAAVLAGSIALIYGALWLVLSQWQAGEP